MLRELLPSESDPIVYHIIVVAALDGFLSA